MWTLAFCTRHLVPASLLRVGQVRQWIAKRLHFPVEEACLIRDGAKLGEEEEVGEEDLYLVTQPSQEEREGNEDCRIVVYVEDTTRKKRMSKKKGQLVSKKYAVKMFPHQTIGDLGQKLWNNSSCCVPPRRQCFLTRGRRVRNDFSIREYLITQRKHEVTFFLSRTS